MTAQTLKLPTLAFEKKREARTRPKSPPPSQVDEIENKFIHGWRYVTKTLPNGEQTYDEIPLKPKDFLNPQLGDVMPQNETHFQQNVELFNIFKLHYENDPTVRVFGDMKMRWGIPGLLEPAPDIAVIKNIKNKASSRSSFDVVKEGTRPSLVIEIVSPNYPGDDKEKVAIYERAGITEYFIINPHSDKDKPYYELWGYRLKGPQYRPIKPDKQGRLLSQTTGVLFQVADDHKSIILIDANTNEKLLTAQEEKAARLEAQAKAQAQAQARLEAEAKIKALEQRLRELEAKQK
jgi:Uma2 family endonuclease